MDTRAVLTQIIEQQIIINRLVSSLSSIGFTPDEGGQNPTYPNMMVETILSIAGIEYSDEKFDSTCELLTNMSAIAGTTENIAEKATEKFFKKITIH